MRWGSIPSSAAWLRTYRTAERASLDAIEDGDALLRVAEPVLDADSEHAEIGEVFGEGVEVAGAHSSPATTVDGEKDRATVGFLVAGGLEDVEGERAVVNCFVDDFACWLHLGGDGVEGAMAVFCCGLRGLGFGFCGVCVGGKGAGEAQQESSEDGSFHLHGESLSVLFCPFVSVQVG